MFNLKFFKILLDSLGKPSEQDSESVAVVLIHATSIVFYIIFHSTVLLPFMHYHPTPVELDSHSCPQRVKMSDKEFEL